MRKFKLTTPVVFIIFNRPDTTQRVFDVIKKLNETINIDTAIFDLKDSKSKNTIIKAL